jgi:hypothetical protein
MEQTGCSETLAFKLQTPGKTPEESKRLSKQGESLKSRKVLLVVLFPLGDSPKFQNNLFHLHKSFKRPMEMKQTNC